MYNQTVVKRMAGGDDGAFHIMYEDWVGSIYVHAYDVLHDAALARSATRRAFVRIYERRAELKDNRRFDEWVMEQAAATVAETALARRTLTDAEREAEWALIADSLGIADRLPYEEWKPIYFAPDEDEQPQSAEAAETAEAPLPAVADDAKLAVSADGEAKQAAAAKRKSKRSTAAVAAAAGALAAAAMGCALILALYYSGGSAETTLAGALGALAGALGI